MIIQVRGTSGSGKSYTIRKAIEGINFERHLEPGKKRPLYLFSRKYDLAVLGHYETACGGCDGSGIRGMRQVNEVMQKISVNHGDVQHFIFEGAILSEDAKWSGLFDDYRGLFLTTSLEQCIENVRQRRIAGGRDPEFKTKNTENRFSVIERARIRLLDAGVFCKRCSSEQASSLIRKWLKIR